MRAQRKGEPATATLYGREHRGREWAFHVTDNEILVHPHWSKTREFLLVEPGRWGPKWLHRLVLRMAKNLGMVRHEKVNIPSTSVHRIVIHERDVFAYAQEAIDLYHRRFHRLDDCEIIIGQEVLTGLMVSLRDQLPGSIRIGVGGHGELQGIPFRVVPLFEGCAVIPLRRGR
jgi:hypothetical protein